MSLFDGGPFDFDGDGKMNGLELMMAMQMTARTRKEAIELTGNDAFYSGNDTLEDDEEMFRK